MFSLNTAYCSTDQIFIATSYALQMTVRRFPTSLQSPTRWTCLPFAVSGAGGEPLALEGPSVTLGELGLTITPLVRGHLPWEVNIWTLNGGYSGFMRDGTAYFLFGMDTLEQFAGEEVYFAAYAGEGNAPPSAERFSMAEDGVITCNSGVDGVMFNLHNP